MQELKEYLKNRIENINEEIKLGKNKQENIRIKRELLNIDRLIDMMNKHNIRSNKILEIITIETATDSSEIRLFDDCDTENKEYWKEFDKVRLSSGDIIIKRKF